MRYFLVLLTIIIFANTNPAFAQRSDSIAAVVNGDVVTYTNLYDRMDLVIKSSRMPNTEAFKERLMPQILTGLITEQIQMQEAERLNITVGAEEVEKGFADLAGQNNLASDQFKKILKAQNVNLETLKNQIRSQLAWGKVIQQEIRPRVGLTSSDISNEIERLKAREGQEEYFIAEIYLPIDNTNSNAEVSKAANDLSRQLSNDISKFPEAARQFSQSATAANGGIIGWVTPDQLSSGVGQRLKTMGPASVSEPIQDDEGYTILFVRDKRVIDLGTNNAAPETLRIKSALFSLPDDQHERKAVNEDARNFAQNVKGCLDIMKQVSKRNNAKLQEYDDTINNIPSNIRESVVNTNIGSVGKIIETDQVIIVPMLCGRDAGGNSNAALEREVENRIGTQRLDVLQKRYLRDLVTEAYIERRV